ncbi:MAG TPA: hypothetical protein EYN38_06850, partial [Flavobacteriales bacterium]|nr:hypothetical protein [Flavobacteriales bacterium]
MKPLCLKKHQLKALNFIIALILLTMPPNDCIGQCLDLVITEVSIAPLGGGQGQESREFIELHNTTTSPIDVAGYWLRTDENNDINSPIFADVEIVDWTTRRPNNAPNDLVAGPLTLTSTIIPAGGYALIVSPRAHVYTDVVAPFYDIADNTVCLTPTDFLYWGGSNTGPFPPNNWLNNEEDFVVIYDGDPSLPGSALVDSFAWIGTEPNGGWTIQRDDDCIFRWHSSTTSPTAAGFTADGDGSILAPISAGSANTLVFGFCCLLIGNDTSICQGDSILLTASGSTTGYNWVDSLTFTPVLATDSFYMASPIITTTYAMYNTTDTSYVTVTVLPIQSTNVSDTICQGDSIQLPGGSYASTAGVFNDTLSSVDGCDSITITTLVLNPTYNTPETASICDGDSIILGGASQTVAGTYMDTLSSVDGCDSVISTTLSINPLAVIDSVVAVDVSTCGATDGAITIYVTGGTAPISYSIDGGSTFPNTTGMFTGLSAGSYNIVIDDTLGCMVVGGSVTVTEPTSISIDLVVSTDVTGCFGDSTGTISITASGGTAPLSYSIDGGVTFQSSGLFTGLPAGIYSIEVQDASFVPCTAIGNGDTITEPALIVGTDAISICDNDSILLGGSFQNTAGTYIDTLTASGGCDSVVTTSLTINVTYLVAATAAICDDDSILLGGAFQNTSGVYVDSLLSTNGCDSLISTTLTVNAAFANAVSATICSSDSSFLQGAWQTTAGTYVDSFTVNGGCDSVVTTTLSVDATSSNSVNRIICPGDSSFAQGAWQTTSGTYFDSLLNTFGCDSVVTINLSVSSPILTTSSIQICSGDSSFLQGSWQTIAGTYVDSFIAVGGCDSLMSTTLSVGSVVTNSVSSSICDFDSLFVGGGWQTTNGTYMDTLATSTGCDSIVTTTLTVTAFVSNSVSMNICEGDSTLLAGAFQT